MKRFLLFLSVCAVVTVKAQTRGATAINFDGGEMNINSSDISKQKQIGVANMDILYDYKYITDTTDNSKLKSDRMILQVGKNITKFYSYLSMKADSLISVASAEEVLANVGKFKGGETFSVYTNYPHGKITTIDKMGVDWFCVEEVQQKIDWKLMEDIKDILGYKCHKAQCFFRGRSWIVWYSEQIPVPVGPWKLHGLPGAILEAVDSEGHYSFVMVGITAKFNKPIIIVDKKFNTTSVDKYYKTLRKFKSNPFAALQNSGINVKIMHPDGTPMNQSDLIKELKYDFIER